MERFNEDDTIDLGSATEETKGSIGALGDENGLHKQVGISND